MLLEQVIKLKKQDKIFFMKSMTKDKNQSMPIKMYNFLKKSYLINNNFQFLIKNKVIV